MAGPAPKLSRAQQAHMAALESAFHGAAPKDNPRYSLRKKAAMTIVVGSILNFASLLVAFIEYRQDISPRWPISAAVVVYIVSFLYSLYDLLSQHPIPLLYICIVDAIGFGAFLVLLVVNGIIITNLRAASQLFTYNSVPWMMCCAIHGIIALKAFKQLTLLAVRNMGMVSPVHRSACSECRKRSQRLHGKSKGKGDYEAEDDEEQEEEGEEGLLIRPEEDSERDVEAGA